MKLDFNQQLVEYHESLEIEIPEGHNIEIMNPYMNSEVAKYFATFMKKFYSDHNKRVLCLGINPGRLGAGSTGIAFTDPKLLQEVCGIQNDLPKTQELSAQFIYKAALKWQCIEEFYSQIFISSVFPLGYIKDGLNFNYYDTAEAMKLSEKTIISHLDFLKDTGFFCNHVICLGKGKNFKVLASLNKEHSWFEKVTPLPHPRWIMQYNRKKIEDFTTLYFETISEIYQGKPSA